MIKTEPVMIKAIANAFSIRIFLVIFSLTMVGLIFVSKVAKIKTKRSCTEPKALTRETSVREIEKPKDF